jgi:PKD repeat protein
MVLYISGTILNKRKSKARNAFYSITFKINLMKHMFKVVMVAAISFAASKINAQFVDLSTGKTVTLVKHNGNGMMLNPETQRPVHIYVNTATK